MVPSTGTDGENSASATPGSASRCLRGEALGGDQGVAVAEPLGADDAVGGRQGRASRPAASPEDAVST